MIQGSRGEDHLLGGRSEVERFHGILHRIEAASPGESGAFRQRLKQALHRGDLVLIDGVIHPGI